MIYVTKTNNEGKITSIQGSNATRETAEAMIKNNADNGIHGWEVLETDREKRMAEFHIEQTKRISRKYDLDDIVERLNQIENELYDFRRFVQDESKRIKDASESSHP